MKPARFLHNWIRPHQSHLALTEIPVQCVTIDGETETYLQKHTQHRQTIRMASSLGEALVFALVPVDKVQLAGERLTIHRMLGATRIRTSPVAVELLENKLFLLQRSPGQHGTLAVYIHPPAVARIDQAARVLWYVRPAERILLQIARVLRFGSNNVDRRLTLSPCLREHFRPLLGSCGGRRMEKERWRENV